MKKAICILLDLFSILFLAGGYLIQHFTMAKLGMNRWVVYQQMKAKKAMPVDLLRYVVPIVLLLLILFLWNRFMKEKKQSLIDRIMMIIMTLAEAFYLGFSVIMNSGKLRAIYLVLPCIGLSVVMLFLRNLIQVTGYEK